MTLLVYNVFFISIAPAQHTSMSRFSSDMDGRLAWPLREGGEEEWISGEWYKRVGGTYLLLICFLHVIDQREMPMKCVCSLEMTWNERQSSCFQIMSHLIFFFVTLLLNWAHFTAWFLSWYRGRLCKTHWGSSDARGRLLYEPWDITKKLIEYMT